MGGAESREAAAETATRHSMPPVSSSSPPQAAAASSGASSGVSSSAGRAPSASVGHDSRATAAGRELEAGGIERGQEAAEEATKELSYWYLFKHGYNELVHLIIRPPRARYDPEELGPARFDFAGREFARDDFVVRNDREQGLQCSLWYCASASSTANLMPCVVYLHGNSSCRLEALGVLRTCLAAGASVAAFDCSGCGLSDGEYISLGFFERDDLRSVIDHLRAHCRVGAVALWGRSMGAATALLHADRDPTIAGIIVDSAFTDLDALVQEVVERGRQEGLTLPKLLVKLVMKFVRSSVQKRAHFDIKKLAPIDHAAASFVPVLFVAAEDDSFIAPHHSDRLYERYGGDKNIVKVDGDHNSARPQFLLDSAGIFLQAALQIDPRLVPDLTLGTSSSSGRRRRRRGNRPPWEASRSRRRRASTSSASSARGFASPLSADARFSGKDSLLAPMEPWPCPSCTYINAPLCIQCEMCRDLYMPDEDDDDPGHDQAQDDEDDPSHDEHHHHRPTRRATYSGQSARELGTEDEAEEEPSTSSSRRSVSVVSSASAHAPSRSVSVDTAATEDGGSESTASSVSSQPANEPVATRSSASGVGDGAPPSSLSSVMMASSEAGGKTAT